MAGELALGAEVLGRLHEPGPEVHLPEPVHGDPGGQRVPGVDEPAGERQAVGLDALGQRRQDRGHAGEHLLGGGVVGTAVQPVGGLADGPLLHDHDGREARPQLVALPLEPGHLAHRLLDRGRRVLVEEREPQLVGLGRGPLAGLEGRDLPERLARSPPPRPRPGSAPPRRRGPRRGCPGTAACPTRWPRCAGGSGSPAAGCRRGRAAPRSPAGGRRRRCGCPRGSSSRRRWRRRAATGRGRSPRRSPPPPHRRGRASTGSVRILPSSRYRPQPTSPWSPPAARETITPFSAVGYVHAARLNESS